MDFIENLDLFVQGEFGDRAVVEGSTARTRSVPEENMRTSRTTRGSEENMRTSPLSDPASSPLSSPASSEIWGIFDERYEPILDEYSVGSFATGSRITFKVKTSDTDGLRHGDRLNIKGQNYSITGINLYGDGKMSEITLKNG